MSGLGSAEEWQRAADACAEASPDWLDAASHAAMVEWTADDAVDTLDNVLRVPRGLPVPPVLAGAALASHMELGVRLGVWLAKTGRL